MNNCFKRLILIFFIIFVSCAKDKDVITIIDQKDIDLQMIDSYKKGLKALEAGDALFAAKQFNEAELLYPQSEWASRSALMAAYAYYIQNYYGDAIFELERFLKYYPKDKNLSYAHYLLAICYFEKIVDEKKDLKPLIEAEKRFQYIKKTYPDTDFAIDAKFKYELIQNILASKEVYIGRYYIEKEKWIASIKRFQNVINKYETTDYVEEALHRLVEIYYKIGLVEESQKHAALLGYNYQSSKWYKEAYRVYNKDYEDPINAIKKEKKKKSLIKKFKTLFD